MPNVAGNEAAGESRLDELLADYLRRVDTGERIDRDQFLRAHGDLAGELMELLETADLVDRMAGPALAVAGAQAAQGNHAGKRIEPAREATPTTPAETDPGRQETLVYHKAQPAESGRGQPPGTAVQDVAGRKFGNYELLAEIGRGGMGVVYKARQVRMNRIVAVKMILTGRLASEADLKRFYAEAQAAGKLRHPNIVGIHQAGEVDGYHFYSMDYIEGTTLSEVSRRQQLSARRMARYVKQVARAVHYAHQHGILHRDLKPSNVLINGDDQPHVTDFGLAKQVGQETGLTSTGAALGTPSYMSPEQAAGDRAETGPASDVYSLGAILYELLTGRPPFRAESPLDTLLRVIHEQPDAPRSLDPAVDRDLETICLKCLRKNPRRRYASAQEMADDLERFLAGEPIQAKPIGKWSKAWRWVCGVPLVAALIGRKLTASTPWQKRVQSAIVAAVLMVLAAFAGWMVWPETLPPRIRVATGTSGGMYHCLGADLAAALQRSADRPVEALQTSGSVENRELLLSGKVELALLQSNAVSGGRLAIVAPLYYERTYVVVRKGQGIDTIADLKGKAVSLGPADSGMRLTARKILRYYEVGEQTLRRSNVPFQELLTDRTMQAAIVTIGFDDSAPSGLKDLLSDPRFELLPIPQPDAERISEANPSFLPTHIRQQHVPAGFDLPAEGIPSVMTAAFLTVRQDATDLLVTTTLEALYLGGDLADGYGLISPEDAARERALHPAALMFFESLPTGTEDQPAP